MCNTHHTSAIGTQAPDPEGLFRRQFLKYIGAAGLVGASSGLASCATNPETGRSQLLAFAPSDAALAQAAAQSWADVKQQTPTSNDPRYTSRL